MAKFFAVSLFVIIIQCTFIINRAHPDFVVDTERMEPVLSKLQEIWYVTYAVTHSTGAPRGDICFHKGKYYVRNWTEHSTTGYEIKKEILPMRVAQVKTDQAVKIKQYVDGEQSPFFNLNNLKKFKMSYHVRAINGNDSVSIVHRGDVLVEDDQTVEAVREKVLGMHKERELKGRKLNDGVDLGKCKADKFNEKNQLLIVCNVKEKFDNGTLMKDIFDKDQKNAEESFIFTVKNNA